MIIENAMYRTLLVMCGSAEMLLNDGRPIKLLAMDFCLSCRDFCFT